jgi:hypothetical protein
LVQIESTNLLVDGWGEDIRLIPATNAPGAMLLMSYGPDRVRGGIGTNGDIIYLLK